MQNVFSFVNVDSKAEIWPFYEFNNGIQLKWSTKYENMAIYQSARKNKKKENAGDSPFLNSAMAFS